VSRTDVFNILFTLYRTGIDSTDSRLSLFQLQGNKIISK